MYVRVVEISGDYGVQERQVTRVNRIITIFFVVFIVCFYFIIILLLLCSCRCVVIAVQPCTLAHALACHFGLSTIFIHKHSHSLTRGWLMQKLLFRVVSGCSTNSAHSAYHSRRNTRGFAPSLRTPEFHQ